MIAETDASLVRRTLQGDSFAFDQLIVRHQGQMHRLAFGMIRDEADAWDVVQQSFLLAFSQLGSLQRTDQFLCWLHQITRRTALSTLRRRRPEFSLETLSAGGLEPVAPVFPPDELAQHDESRRRLGESLGRLCPKHREVVELQLLGHSYPTIAKLLGLPVGTVRSRLHRARQQLREQLCDALPDSR